MLLYILITNIIIWRHIYATYSSGVVRCHRVMSTFDDLRASADASHLEFLTMQCQALRQLDDVSDGPFAWAFATALRAGLSQRILAVSTNTSQPTVSRWSRGEHLPRNEIIRRAYLEVLLVCFDQHIAGFAAGRPDGAPATRPRLPARRLRGASARS